MCKNIFPLNVFIDYTPSIHPVLGMETVWFKTALTMEWSGGGGTAGGLGV